LAYVLMDNHFHLLAETPLGNLSQFMRRFNITYTSYFNRTHKRVLMITHMEPKRDRVNGATP
jgi:REP element-mobilizing transposase RayT